MRTGTGFAMIENYKKMLKSLEDHVDEPCDDQKVPDSQERAMPDFLKTTIKVEETHQQDFCSLTDMLTDECYHHDSHFMAQAPHSLSDFNKSSCHIPSSEHFLSNEKDFLQTPIPTSSEVLFKEICMSIPSSFSNSVPSQSLEIIPQPLCSSISFSSSPPSTFKATMNTKTRTYVTELAGSGCTVISNSSNCQSNTNADLLEDFSRGESLEYIDLDKPAMYDTKRSFQTQGSNDSELENAVQCVQDIIKQDSENLNIPFDPESWTCEHVCRWVDWTCQKNQIFDVSMQIAAFNGQVLCSWTHDDFSSQFGSSGGFLYNELDLWKAANSCFSHPSKLSQGSIPLPTDYFVADNSFPLSPASSPALSSCGSSSNDSSCNLSQHSDMTEEDSFFHPDVKITPKSDSMTDTKVYKRIPGRGHKKSIALWQFLKRLLLSEQNYGCIRWIDRKAGIFKIEDSKKVANLWGAEKNRPAMNYDKLSRSVRQYYKKGIIKKPAQSKRLLYQFCPEYL